MSNRLLERITDVILVFTNGISMFSTLQAPRSSLVEDFELTHGVGFRVWGFRV